MSITTRTAALAITALALVPAIAIGNTSGPWSKCSTARGEVAAREAGVPRALNGDHVLRTVFSGTTPSSVYRQPAVSLCGHLGSHAARAVLYRCCTVSSPAPWAVLRRLNGRWRIAYARLHDTTWKLDGNGRDPVTTEPKYDLKHDSLCCPSHLRIGTLRWTTNGFRRTFKITSL